MMYLLLRDNKQSGPYTLDEIKAKGLKAYDLVWVEGRSAAWRYPSEINELSAFAPAVEEQPFDRFFKKPAANNGMTRLSTTSTPALATQAAVSNTTTIKRTIYVTMPGGSSRTMPGDPGRSFPGETNRAMAPELTRDGAGEVPSARETVEVRQPRREYAQERAPQEGILPVLPKRKSNRLGQFILLGFSMLALLAAGIFIGLSIQKSDNRLDKLAVNVPNANAQSIRPAPQQVPVTSAAPGHGPSSQAASAPGDTAAKTTLPAEGGLAQNRSVDGPVKGSGHPGAVATTGPAITGMANTGPASNIPTKKIRHPRQKADGTKLTASLPPATDSAAATPEPIHREAVHRTDLPTGPSTDKEGLRLTLANQVSVGANKFEVGTFGGIHNLQVTVTNRSAFALDLVVVEVDYIQANKKTYKSENLYFRSIGPGSALMLEAPKSSRGINVQYKITSINAKELGLSEPGT